MQCKNEVQSVRTLRPLIKFHLERGWVYKYILPAWIISKNILILKPRIREPSFSILRFIE